QASRKAEAAKQVLRRVKPLQEIHDHRQLHQQRQQQQPMPSCRAGHACLHLAKCPLIPSTATI
ncbi:hypothetical protein GGI05_006993, partial [Coemansia sp. RSA 2603]